MKKTLIMSFLFSSLLGAPLLAQDRPRIFTPSPPAEVSPGIGLNKLLKEKEGEKRVLPKQDALVIGSKMPVALLKTDAEMPVFTPDPTVDFKLLVKQVEVIKLGSQVPPSEGFLP